MEFPRLAEPGEPWKTFSPAEIRDARDGGMRPRQVEFDPSSHKDGTQGE